MPEGGEEGEEEGEGVEGRSYLLTLPGHKRVILTPHISQTTLSSGFPAATNIT